MQEEVHHLCAGCDRFYAYILSEFFQGLSKGGMIIPILIFFLVFLFIFETERERQSMSRGGAEREGDTESEAGSGVRAVHVEPDAGLEFANREIVT